MGKYSSLNLPRYNKAESEDDPKYQDKVDAAKAEFTNRKASALTAEWLKVRDEADRLAEQVYACNVKVEALRQLMDDAYEAEGVDAIKTDAGGARKQPKPYTKVEDKAALRAWWDKEGLELQINWNTMNALNATRLLEGLPELPGVSTHFKSTFVRSK